MLWYSLEDIARRAGYCILPEGGAWVCLVGCPTWPRGQRIIPAHRELGIQHFDIYWGCKEIMSIKPRVNRYRRRNISLPQAIAYDVSTGRELEEALDRATDALRDHLENDPFGGSLQRTLITISFPYPEEVRFYDSELKVFTGETIRLLLERDQLEIHLFGEAQRIILDDAAQELVDAFQIDGLSWAQAYQEIVSLGVVEPGDFIPQWFYRPRGWFRQQFCEED